MHEPDMPDSPVLPDLGEMRPRTMTEQVFDALYERIVDLTLSPGTRMSEAEVAAQMGVSRQPVRDAFFRLSQLGLLQLRPQRATIVTLISERAIREASFIRQSLELSCIRKAATRLTGAQHDALETLLDQQQEAEQAGRRGAFHALDEQFHHDIATYADLGFVWTLVKEQKGHMDRARFQSLSFSPGRVLSEHRDILRALRRRDPEAAVRAMSVHLGRMNETLTRLRAEQPDMMGE
ncbi:GntR family transcriptional regulator [Paracoccus sp. (in: a-proteobacteria)]|uniref:GntR family transcriptional regulator n=1 Tax=Paracoccus sp. TaxID=267 RepID=UPI003A87D1CC